MTDWVRLWHDMPTDPKWRVVARKSCQPLACVVALFTLMMTTASAAASRGDVSGLSIEDAAAALDMEEDAVAAILAAMEGRVVADGRLSGWERRQPKREGPPSTERVREFRERQAALAKRDETQRNAPETETETETDPSEATASSGAGSPSSSRAGSGSRGSSLPDDWQPKPQHYAKGAERGQSHPWVDAQAEKMRDWAIANRNRAVARKADWDRTFSGWLDREFDKASPPRGSPDRQTQADHRLNAHHSLFGQAHDRDHHEVEIIPPSADQGHGRPDRPVHGQDAGDVGPGRVRDFGRLRAVG